MSNSSLNPQQLSQALLELVQASSDVFWIFSEAKRITVFVSPAFETVWGHPPEVALTDPTVWTRTVHPEDREPADAVFKNRHKPGHFDHTFRLVRPNGTVVWVRDRGWLVPGDGVDGQLFVGIAEDVTEQIQTQQGQEILVNEVDHRARNILAVLQSIVLQSKKGARTVDEFSDGLLDRIGALARTHDLLRARHWKGAMLRDIAEDELRAYRTGEGGQNVTLEGQDIDLSARTAAALGMTFHELATNAAKYGALSDPTGHLHISWDCLETHVRIQWIEATTRDLPQPARSGFGSKLIQRMIRLQLGGTTDLAFGERGIRCTIDIPFDCMNSHPVQRTPG